MNPDEIPGLGVYTASEGDVYRNGIYLGNVTAERLLALYEANTEPYAARQATRLRRAIRQARAYHESEAA